MQNVKAIAPVANVAATVATPATVAPVKAKPAKAKAAPKAKAATPAPVADAKPVAVNVHRGTVATSHYTGPSQYLNANRTTAIGVTTYAGRNVAGFTARTIGTLIAMRDAYAGKAFPARGFDNAVVAMLAGAVAGGKAAPMLKISGGHIIADKNGRDVYADAPGKPVMLTLTPAALAYGKATAPAKA